MIIKIVSVNRMDRGRACRAWEAFSLLIVSPVVVDRQHRCAHLYVVSDLNHVRKEIS
jgi:hypothetical protein